MDPRKFVSSAFGAVVTDPLLAWDYPFYKPADIPRNLEFRQETNQAVQNASLALGQLSGASMLLTDPALLLGPSMAQEAVQSSRIEGTQASLSDVLSAEAEQEDIADPDLHEVNNYLLALNEGASLLNDLPISQRFFKQLHHTLLQGVRGEEKLPGETRSSPVWIGAADATPRTAAFIPPHNDYVPNALSDWEKFANEADNYTTVVKSGLLHYQFETIHPFLDGNGRIGRLLILFVFMQDGVLRHPTLGVSGYFEKHRDEYYARLQNVREKGEIDEWIQFFSAGIEYQSKQSAQRIGSLVEIRERYRQHVTNSGDRSALTRLVEVIFRNPVVTVESVCRKLQISQPTASGALRKAETLGWLDSAGRWGRGGKERWIATEIWQTVTEDVSVR